MAESLVHKGLVKDIRFWIESKYHGRGLTFIWIDNCVEEGFTQQKRIDNFIPDVFAKCISEDLEIIGEAKTGADIQSRHSEEQLQSYLKYCDVNHSIFILAVPYIFKAFANNLLRSLRPQTESLRAKIFIIDDLTKRLCKN